MEKNPSPAETISEVSKPSYEQGPDMPSTKRRPNDVFERFKDFFKDRPTDKKVCIVLQHTPDPDAIGSALGLEWILEAEYGLQCDIFYSGQISHPQNQTEVNVLDVRLKHKDDFEAENYSTFVTVDSVPQNTGFDEIEEWHCVFDHHQFDMDLPVTDIRTCGSCSAIIWDYICHFDLDFETERGILVATALLFGVVNDTHNLLDENVSKLDLDAHSHLIAYIDRKKFHSIVHHPLPPYLFELRALAASNMVNEASILISYLGILSSKRRDALPIIADEFLRMEGVETVVVFCLIDGFIHASVRSRNSSVNVHNFCQKVFGPESSGGKSGSGGAKVPLGFLYSPEDDGEDQQKLSEFAKATITKRIIRHLSGA